MKLFLASFFHALLVSLCAPLANAQNQTWIRQLGTPFGDSVQALATDGASGVYVGGYTFGDLGGANAGEMDAWLARCDSAGNVLWIRQLGTNWWDLVYAAAPDGSGGVFVGGRTDGVQGGTTPTYSDPWLARYDSAGNQAWFLQFGSNRNDYVYAAASDGSGGVIVGGSTEGSLAGPNQGSSDDAWLARFDHAGNQLWILQFGTSSDDFLWAIAPDGAGGVIAGGGTRGDLGGQNPTGYSDAWLARYDAGGNQVWIRQFGSGDHETLRAIASDGAGGAFAAGRTWASLGGPNAGLTDVWIARYGSAGNRLWIRQFGTITDEHLTSAASDGMGGVIVGGHTGGNLAGPSAGPYDAWLARYDGVGNRTWIRQFGSSGFEEMWTAVWDGSNGVFVGGNTHGSFAAPNVGVADAWFAHYEIAPPVSTFCTSGTTTNGCAPAIRGVGAPSASATSGFTIAVDDVEGQKQGLLFYGVDNGGFTPLPWGAGSSFFCVKTPVQRAAALHSGGTANQCDGALAFDWNTYRSANPTALGQPFTAGMVVYAQGWFRDAPSPKTTSLSDGLRFVLQP